MIPDPKRLEQEVEKIKAAALRSARPEAASADPVAIARELGLVVVDSADLARLEAEHRAALMERDRVEKAAARAAQWVKRCPLVYREPFDRARVHAEVLSEELEKVLGWKFGPRGLYVLGSTGRSKSRAVGHVLGRHFLEGGRSVHYVDGMTFAIEAGANLGNPTDALKWVRKLCDPDILWIDDFAKRWTPSTEEAAYMVVEHRTSQGKPIVITNNFNRDEMLKRAHEPGVVEPTLRRLKDYCEIAEF